MSLFRFVICASFAAAATPAIAGTLAEDAKAFGTRQFIQSMDISPSGNKVIMLVSAKGAATTANIVDLGTAQVTRLAETDGRPETLYWCAFAGEEHVVCQYGGIDRVGTDLVGFSRLVTVRADGSKMQPLGQKDSSRARYVMLSDGGVIDWMPGREGQVLLQRSYVPEVETTGHLLSRTKEGLGVDQIDLDSGKSKEVEAPRTTADEYFTDGRGNVRVYGGWVSNKNSGQMSGVYRFRYRPTGSKDWVELGTYDSTTRQGPFPLAVDGERNVLFVRQRLNNRDALYQLALDGSKTLTLVAKNDQVDIDGVVRFGRGQRVIGYTFADERRRVVYFDPEFDKLHSSLAKAVPNKPSIDFEQSSSDGQHQLILAAGDDEPGTFYTYSRAAKALKEVAPIRPGLEGRKLASVRPIMVPAADGVSIPAYLTLPPGASGKALPAVVMPHGGPEARDEWGFDWLAQFLAARGYAVIQPNFRGSGGYGDAWLGKNGFQGWATSIGDVTASAKYLVSQGIADPAKMVILGWSYGGYAALQSAAVEPGLYRAAVAIAPVTDFAMWKAEQENFTNRDLMRKLIGEGPHLVEGSPLQQARKIKVPVLMFHGDMDANVGIAESERMAGALNGVGARVELVTFKGLDHQLDDSDARIQMLTKIGTFIDGATGR